MARNWPPPDGPDLPDYLRQLSHDLEEARDAMARDERRRARRAVRAALDRPHPEGIDAAETAVLVALGLGVAGPGDVAKLSDAYPDR